MKCYEAINEPIIKLHLFPWYQFECRLNENKGRDKGGEWHQDRVLVMLQWPFFMTQRDDTKRIMPYLMSSFARKLCKNSWLRLEIVLRAETKRKNDIKTESWWCFDDHFLWHKEMIQRKWYRIHVSCRTFDVEFREKFSQNPWLRLEINCIEWQSIHWTIDLSLKPFIDAIITKHMLAMRSLNRNHIILQ